MTDLTPGEAARSEQVLQDLLNLTSHLVVLARSRPEMNAHDTGIRLHYAILTQWPPKTIAAVLSVAATELARTGWATHPRATIEGVVDPFPLAGEPLTGPTRAENTPDQEKGSEDA